MNKPGAPSARRWTRAQLCAQFVAALVISGCTVARPAHREPPAEAPPLPPASGTAWRSVPPAPSGGVLHPRVLEENELGEAAVPASGATPAAPEQVAALAVPTPGAAAPVAPPAAAAVTANEPEPVTRRVGPNTPPNVAAALRLIEDGRQQMNQKNYDQALDRFERAVSIDPVSPYGYYFLARLHYVKKNYDQAVAFTSRAAALVPRTDAAWVARIYSLQGAVFEDAGRYPDARKAYQHAVDADPNNLAARVGIARLSAQ